MQNENVDFNTGMADQESSKLTAEQELTKKANKNIGIALIAFSVLSVGLAIYSESNVPRVVINGIVNCIFASNFLSNQRKAKNWFSLRIIGGFFLTLGSMLNGSILDLFWGGAEVLFYVYIFLLFFGVVNSIKYKVANRVVMPITLIALVIGFVIVQKHNSAIDEIANIEPKFESLSSSIERYQELVSDTINAEQLATQNFALEDSVKLLKSYFLTMDGDFNYLSRYGILDSNDRKEMDYWKENTKEIRTAIGQSEQ